MATANPLPPLPKTQRPAALKRWLSKVKLASGGHSSPQDGACLLEVVAYVQRRDFNDHPVCVAPTIAAFGRTWNDSLPDAERQRLKRFIPLMVDTATTKADETTRAWMATDWLVREFAPVWLDRAGLTEHAAKLRALEALSSAALAKKAQPIIDDACRASSAAWAAAWAAAGAAAGAAAWAAARDAAGYAARAAAFKTKPTNRAAMDAALAPTVQQLQASAEDLLERMCAVGR